ncbi:extracellular solute-binding protein [Zafaria sp. Z1313]|uniref:extracellular solute-binding protein n=1 Tax=unclassified Zafaria TaxID=2828765 RepID=UPI002E7654C7|nr:extracellular solute-binding protein [Zafaria sp. J156]MEE1622675.1 extracellular solute-binding protein [Zafaria sp. J156]
MKPIQRTSLAALAAAAMLGLAACGGGSAPAESSATTSPAGSSPSEPAAASDNKITLYSGRSEDLVQPIIDQFTEATGIDVEVRYGNTAAMAAQLLEEGDKSPADVFLAQDAGALGAASSAGLFAALPESITSVVPEAYRDGNGEWVGVTARARVLIHNKELAPADTLPDTVEELNGEEFKGQLGVAPTNASFQAFITALRVLDGEDAAKQYLADLKANDPQIREGNGGIVADVNDGKIPFGLVNHYYLFELAKEKGVEPDELDAANYFFPNGDIGALVNIAGAGLVKHAADDDGVKLLEFLLSEEGQTYFAEETSEYPMLESVPGPAGIPALTELQVPDVDLNDLEDLETTIALITEAGLA